MSLKIINNDTSNWSTKRIKQVIRMLMTTHLYNGKIINKTIRNNKDIPIKNYEKWTLAAGEYRALMIIIAAEAIKITNPRKYEEYIENVKQIRIKTMRRAREAREAVENYIRGLRPIANKFRILFAEFGNRQENFTQKVGPPI